MEGYENILKNYPRSSRSLLRLIASGIPQAHSPLLRAGCPLTIWMLSFVRTTVWQ